MLANIVRPWPLRDSLAYPPISGKAAETDIELREHRACHNGITARRLNASFCRAESFSD
jgi:hypothetical protein